MSPRRLRYLRVNDHLPLKNYDVLKDAVPLDFEDVKEWFPFCKKLARQELRGFELMTVDFNFLEDRSGPTFPFRLTHGESRTNKEFVDVPLLSELKWSDMLHDTGPNTGLIIGVYLAGYAALRDVPCGIAFHTYNPLMVVQDMSSILLATQLLLATGVELPLTSLADMLRTTAALVGSSENTLHYDLGSAISRFRHEFVRRTGAESSDVPVRIWLDSTSVWSLMNIFSSVESEEELDRELNENGIDFYDRHGILDSIDVRSVFFDRLLRDDGRILSRLLLSDVKPKGPEQPANGIIWEFVNTLALKSASNVAPVMDYFRRFKSGADVPNINKALRHRPLHRLIALVFAWIDAYAHYWVQWNYESWDPAEEDFEPGFSPLTRQVSELLRIMALAKEAGWKSESLPATGTRSIRTLLDNHLASESPLWRALHGHEETDKRRYTLALQHLLDVAQLWGCITAEDDETTGKRYRLVSTIIPDRRSFKCSQSDLAIRLGFEAVQDRDYSRQLTRIIQDVPGYENMSMKEFMSMLEEKPLPRYLQELGWQFVDEFWRNKLERRRLPLGALPICLADLPSSDGGQLEITEWFRQLQASHETVIRIHSMIMPPTQSFQDEFCEVASWYRPAEELGGDYFAMKLNPSGQLGLFLFDVCGKGIPAAMIVQEIHGLVTLLAEQNLSTNEVCHELDERLGARLPASIEIDSSDRWATGIIAVINETEKTFTYANSAHPSALLVRKNGSSQTLDSQSMGMGMLPGTHYYSETVALESGDRLVLYSDGLTEMPQERLLQIICEHVALDSKALVSQIVASMTPKARPIDDTTVVVIAVH